MGIVDNALMGASGQAGYRLTNSVRLRQSASAYFGRTFTSTGNRQIWTWSGWVKRGALSNGALFGADGSNYMFMYFSPDSLDCGEVVSSQQWRRVTTQVFRDPSAWYHIVLAFDSTQATAGNRVKLYVNGTQVTAFSTSADPSLNYNSVVNTTIAHSIGSFAAPTRQAYLDGYLTEVNFIDGQALTPSSFGSTNTLTGVWQPAKYQGTYGANGFYLPFTDNTSATNPAIGNAGIGKDFSGNGNYWTSNNISVYGGTVQSFTSSTTWTAPAGVTSVNYLVVAGGGGGGSATTGINMGGGGGAGGLLQGQLAVIPGNTYTVTIGSGGAANTNGGNSVFGSITATGGGQGAGNAVSPYNAGNGGSGGGGRPYNSLQKGSGIPGQGFDGGSAGSVDVAGGGGGSSSVGGSVSSGTVAGAGGSGTVVGITGSNVTYAGGGGGGAYIGNTAGAGGSGGGGAGGSNANGSNATGYGSGGGGAGQFGNTNIGGSGSAGIVILAYGSSVTYDSMTDVPTLTSATAANFAVLNPLNAETGMGGTLGGGNLDLSGSGGKRSTIAARTGKWYWEFVSNSGAASNFPISGLYVAGLGTYWPGYDGNSFGYFQGGGIYYNGSTSLTVSSYTDGDVLGFAWDADTGKVYVAKNGTWQNSGDPAAGTGQVATVSTGVDRVVGAYNSSGSCSINFGQRPFTYTPPTGFVALNTYNLI